MSAAPAPAARATLETFDVDRVRRDFPALSQEVHGSRLAYLDSAASALKPQPVIDAVVRNYSRDGANVHRGVHQLSQRATLDYESARRKVAAFVNAPEPEELVFVRGTTEGINLVAETWGRTHLREGDEILLTELEHHSNIVPWQLVAERMGATIVVAPVDDDGVVTVEAVEQKLGPRTKVVALAHASNTLGTILPVREIAALAHARDAIVVVDGAQAAPHLPVDVQELGCDFYAFSGHKLYGPNGIGVVWGRQSIFEDLPPYQGGGSMIRQVTFEKTTYLGLPERFEAGTPNIAGAIGLGAAVDYVSGIGLDAIESHERELVAHATEALSEIPGLRIIGTAPDKIGVVSFVVDEVHPHDLGTLVDAEGVAIRTGHHCTQPLMRRFGVPATARASFGIYNAADDVEQLARAVSKAWEMFT